MVARAGLDCSLVFVPTMRMITLLRQVQDHGRAPKNVRALQVVGSHLILLFGENSWHFVPPERIMAFGANAARLSKGSIEVAFVHAIQAAKAAHFERFVVYTQLVACAHTPAPLL
jgi:hypothetical protein